MPLLLNGREKRAKIGGSANRQGFADPNNSKNFLGTKGDATAFK